MFGSLAMLTLLVERGSDTTARDGHGQTALMLALYNDKWCDDIVKWLCHHHIHLLTEENTNGSNVFHYAVDCNRPNVISVLLKYSPPSQMLKKKDRYGNIPLSGAENQKDDTILKMLKGYLKQPKWKKRLSSGLVKYATL